MQYVQRVRGRVGGFAIHRAHYPLLMRGSDTYTLLYESDSRGRFDNMTFGNSVMGGFGVAAGVVTVLAVANGLSTYIFDGQTITQKVDARLGSGGAV